MWERGQEHGGTKTRKPGRKVVIIYFDGRKGGGGETHPSPHLPSTAGPLLKYSMTTFAFVFYAYFLHGALLYTVHGDVMETRGRIYRTLGSWMIHYCVKHPGEQEGIHGNRKRCSLHENPGAVRPCLPPWFCSSNLCRRNRLFCFHDNYNVV